ncbi:alpha/beta hydrolase [Mycobacterium sp. EPa45]|uniref:alpha/beta hydrolase n=1 Tax=Mycobacterium sp. EPa45 TaxID=1545728 RepID=UPI0006422EDF|nr:alpha/beta hydrolase [Mycobacterium sp. EPa45]AKK29375.1 esterase [Mycobacterium sp. EPa45]
MRLSNVHRLATQLGGVLPRSVAALRESADWNPLSGPGVRQVAEVALDELVVTGMTLMSSPPRMERPVEQYAGVAAELAALGVTGAHRDPEPLRVREIRAVRAGVLSYERMSYDHDPRLVAALADGHDGPAGAEVVLFRHGDGPRPWLVWVHGAGQGGMSDILVARVGRIHRDLGFNVALPVQPGHGPRRNRWPAYPGTDPVANVAGMVRAVSEVRAVIGWIEPDSTAIALSGLSLGSAVAALVAGLDKRVGAVALYTPILGLNGMIARHLHRWGSAADIVGAAMASDIVSELTSVIDPLALDPIPPPDRRLIVGAWHDQMAYRQCALAMHEHWGGQLYWHDGGHVGHLFSGAVQAQTELFLRELAQAP